MIIGSRRWSLRQRNLSAASFSRLFPERLKKDKEVSKTTELVFCQDSAQTADIAVMDMRVSAGLGGEIPDRVRAGLPLADVRQQQVDLLFGSSGLSVLLIKPKSTNPTKFITSRRCSTAFSQVYHG